VPKIQHGRWYDGGSASKKKSAHGETESQREQAKTAEPTL
jgi:hypothetical protein